MKLSFKKDYKFTENFISFYLLAAVLLWIKTYMTQLTQFDLGVEGVLQHLLLFINPLGSSLLFLGIALLFKGRRRYISLLIIDFLMTVLLFANVVFYRFFNDYITWPTIFQTQNFGDVSSSVPSMLEPLDILYFLDFILLIVLLAAKKIRIEPGKTSRRTATVLMTLALGISCLNLGLAESDRPQLLTRGFDRNYIVKYLGLYNYTVYDAVESTKASAQRVLADSNDITEIINYTKSNYAAPNPEFFGIAEGKNVIYIHLESIQEFLIDYELNGEEVLPFLNQLVKDPNSLYFDHFYHQTAQGKTADAEFMLENSLFGLPQGSAFITKGRNTYHAAPAILGQNGYTSAVFHGNSGSFWNRNEIYKAFGYDYFFDINSYEVFSDADLAEYGLMDKPFFEQSINYLASLPQPFYTKFITVTHHYPFDLDPELATIEKHTTGDRSVDNYFQTARYADEALEQFFNDLKEAGLYENSIFILYGDHYGISENHNKAMTQVLGKEEISPVANADLQRVPLIIHMPGLEGKTVHKFGGQIDLLPTLLHLLGIDSKDYIQFGTDLLSDNHSQLVPFRNGDYVSPEFYSIGGKFYNPITEQEITDEGQLEKAEEIKDILEEKLNHSDKVVNGDLLRFYTPEGYIPIDPSEYNYNTGK